MVSSVIFRQDSNSRCSRVPKGRVHAKTGRRMRWDHSHAAGCWHARHRKKASCRFPRHGLDFRVVSGLMPVAGVGCTMPVNLFGRGGADEWTKH